MGVPLWHLTHRPAVAFVAPVSEVKVKPVHVEFTLTQPATRSERPPSRESSLDG
jgi:hypothetical protein